MRTLTKTMFAVAAIVALATVGIAAAQTTGAPGEAASPQKPLPWHEYCDGNITVDACKQLVDERRDERLYAHLEQRFAKCLEDHDQEFCDEKKAGAIERYESGERPNRADPPRRGERPDRPDRPDRPERPDRPGDA